MNEISCKNNFDQIVHLPKDKFIFRPSVYGVVFNKGKVLLVRNKSNGKYWFPGGGAEIGEKLDEALKRELKEETNLKINIGELLLFKENFFYYQPLDEAYHAFLFFFLCHPTNKFDSNYICDDLESEKPQWISIDQIKEEDLSDLKEDLYKMLQSLNS